MTINPNNASLKISAGNKKQFPHDVRPQIAFSGRSNVGKSSLINTLLGRKSMARVSSAPGKTVTINYYDIDGKIYFVDLPGYGYAKRSMDSKVVWSTLTDEFFTKNPDRDLLKLVIQLIDVRHGPTNDDIDMINWLIDTETPFIVVGTKADKLSKTALQNTLTEIKNEYFLGTEIDVIPFSSVTREGKQQLWNEILARAEK